MMASVRRRRAPGIRSAASWASLLQGIRFVWHRKTVLGAISLDLFAVLFGGATMFLGVAALRFAGASAPFPSLWRMQTFEQLN